MQTHSYNFSILSMDIPSEDRLCANILACGSALGLEFIFSKAKQAKILFLPKNSVFAHIMLNKAKTDSAFSLIFVNSSSQDQSDELFFQGWPCISANIDSSSLFVVLKQYLKQYDCKSEPKNTELSQYNFATLTDLVKQLHKLITQKEQYFAITNGEKTIFFHLDKNRFFLDSTKHYNFDQSNSSINKLLIHFKLGGSINILTQDIYELSTNKYQISYIANRFFWLLAEQMNKELIDEIDIKNTFGITHWPDFGSLKTDPDYLRICACLAQAPLTPYEIKEKLNIPTTKIIAFLNSSMLCQHLIYGANLNITPKNIVPSLSREEILNCRLSLNIKNSQ